MSLRWITRCMWCLPLLISCAASNSQNLSPVSTADKSQTSLFSVLGMTNAMIQIEQAMGSERIKAIREEHRNPYQLDPQNPFKRFLWAYSLDDRNEAWQELKKIIKINDRFYWAYLGMGVILDSWKVDDQAENNFKKALELGPKIAIGAGRFGRFYLRRNEANKALPLLRDAVTWDSERIEYQYDLARALDLASLPQDAISCYRRILDKDSLQFMAHAELADLLARTGDKAGAVESLAKAASLDASAFEVRILRAALLAELNRDEEGLAAYQEACQLKSTVLNCWQALAQLAKKAGKAELQVFANEHIVKIDLGNTEAHKYLAPIYLERGEIEKAQPSYQAILQKEKENLEALLGMETISENGEDFSKALEYAAMVIKLQPNQPEAKAAQQRLFNRFQVLAEPIIGKTPDQVFGKNRVHIATVYKARLKQSPGMKGDMIIKVRVANDGTVEDVAVSKNTVGDQTLELCAVWNLKRSKFPSGLGATYDFELSLKPGD